MPDYQPLKGAPEHADIRLKRYLADGWDVVGFQHVMATNGRSSDYSIFLKNGADLALYRIISDGERLWGAKMDLLTRDVDR